MKSDFVLKIKIAKFFTDNSCRIAPLGNVQCFGGAPGKKEKHFSPITVFYLPLGDSLRRVRGSLFSGEI